MKQQNLLFGSGWQRNAERFYIGFLDSVFKSSWIFSILLWKFTSIKLNDDVVISVAE